MAAAVVSSSTNISTETLRLLRLTACLVMPGCGVKALPDWRSLDLHETFNVIDKYIER